MANKKNTSNNQLNNGKSQSTFLVRIEYCQNKTWQGKITWAEENKVAHFRSALELLRIMDEAVGSMSQSTDNADEETSVS